MPSAASFFYRNTDGIRITVRPTFLPDQSIPEQRQYVFMYNVRIENTTPQSAQLISRRWRIHDSIGEDTVVAFNFHVQGNGVPSRILWNDGKGHFTSDPSGIGFIPVVDASELVDVNGDGVLDLVISNVIADPVSRVPRLTIMWGNRGGFSLSRSVSVTYGSKTNANDLSFFDVNKDGTQDILLTYVHESGNYGVQVFLVLDAGTRLSDATSSYVDTAVGTRRFDRTRLQDVDGNGLIDLIGVDKRSGVRWEWNGSRFIKRF